MWNSKCVVRDSLFQRYTLFQGLYLVPILQYIVAVFSTLLDPEKACKPKIDENSLSRKTRIK